jgi:endonuclease/exonuclease/phosphatase family metal-dependent hydrolase
MKLHVLTYNIHKCIGGLDRRYDPARIARTIAHHDPDVVLLQEVDDRVPRSRLHRQVDLLGAELGYRHRTFFPNVMVSGGGVYGNAVLSRFPIAEARNIDLTIPPRKQRGALYARIRVRISAGRVRSLHVWNLHLGLSASERREQLRRFLASHPFARFDPRAPMIVGGDLNDLWGTLGPTLLAPAGFRGPPAPVRTFPAFAPIRALDVLYLRGRITLLHAHRSRLETARVASDHLPLVAEVDID